MALRVISSQSLFDTDSSKDDGGELGRLMHDLSAIYILNFYLDLRYDIRKNTNIKKDRK